MKTGDFCIHCYNLEQDLISSHHLCNEGKRCKKFFMEEKKTFVNMQGLRGQIIPKVKFSRKTLESSRRPVKKNIF